MVEQTGLILLFGPPMPGQSLLSEILTHGRATYISSILVGTSPAYGRAIFPRSNTARRTNMQSIRIPEIFWKKLILLQALLKLLQRPHPSSGSQSMSGKIHNG